jgi:subtilisin family serine protease
MAETAAPALVQALASPGGLPSPGPRLSAGLRAKLDPALLPFALGPSDTATVWVAFRDKDPAGPAAEAESLAAFWDRLAPRARARRERAQVVPRVNALDLPVATAYLEPLRAAGFRPFAISRWFNRAAVRVTPEGLERLAALPGVSSIARVRRGLPIADRGPSSERRVSPARGGRQGRSLAGSPVPSAQSGLALGQLGQIGVTAVHDSGYAGTGVLIAILDDGFNFHDKHDALHDQVIPPGFSRDFVDGDTVVTDTTRIGFLQHGTQTFGCLGGILPGVYLGSAYGATFALARTEDDTLERPVEMLYWAQGAEWADSLGADVISSSVGYGHEFDDPLQDLPPSAYDGHTSDVTRAAEIAASKGILVVNAAGNYAGWPAPQVVVPADVNGDSLIAVGAVDTFGTVASFSSRGPTSDGRIKPDLMARGAGAWIVSASGAPDAYLQNDGTSFSTPLVAGLAACLLQARPSWTPIEVIRALRETAANVCAPDNAQGWGLPDGRAALGWTPGPPAPDLPPRGFLELALDNANPFVPRHAALRVRFGLGPRLVAEPRTRLRVFDIRGRLVRNLYLGPLCCGRWQLVEWSGDDADGRAAPPGVYFVHFDVEGRVRNQRVVLLR